MTELDDDALCERILAISPEIRHDVNIMADMIRELVRLERDKVGLDHPDGSFELHPFKEKKDPREPDFVGIGHFKGVPYRGAAWISKINSLKIAVSPQKRK